MVRVGGFRGPGFL